MDFEKLVAYVEENKDEYFAKFEKRRGGIGMNNDKIHVLKDESLGGIEREYVMKTEEVRKAGEVLPKLIPSLEPTDIIHIDGKRYRMVDRKAEVGDKVIIVNAEDTSGKYENGSVITAERSCCTGVENDTVADNDSNPEGFIRYTEYRVLEPVYTCDNCEETLGESACSNRKGGSYCSAKCADEDEELVGVDSSQASPEVLDLLANLARRVTSLEQQLRDTQGNVERFAQEIETSKQVVINTSNVTVNDEADIRKVARQLMELIEKEGACQ